MAILALTTSLQDMRRWLARIVIGTDWSGDPSCGAMRTMPGLPAEPVFMRVDIDDDSKL